MQQKQQHFSSCDTVFESPITATTANNNFNKITSSTDHVAIKVTKPTVTSSIEIEEEEEEEEDSEASEVDESN